MPNSHIKFFSKRMHFLSKWMHVLSFGELQQITDMLIVREIAQKILIVTNVYIFMLLHSECTQR